MRRLSVGAGHDAKRPNRIYIIFSPSPKRLSISSKLTAQARDKFGQTTYVRSFHSLHKLWPHLKEGKGWVKLITRCTDYSVRALSFIAANKKEVVSVSELVKALAIPGPFLRKILQILNKNRILKSVKGLGGGFSLKLKPDKIRLIDLIRIFQGRLKISECFFKKELCPNIKTCILRKKINRIEGFVLKELKSVTIQVLIKEK